MLSFLKIHFKEDSNRQSARTPHATYNHTTYFCGISWEYVTPLYRKDTTTDVWDIFAYMIGDLIFWFIYQRRPLGNFSFKRKCRRGR